MFNAKHYMQAALNKAQEAIKVDEVPIGAVIVQNGIIIASAHNLTRTNIDPTAHAEIVALRIAAAICATDKLTDCDMYVTLEPCPMCAHAISIARIRRLCFGAYDSKGGGVENGPRIFSASSCHHAPEYYGGIMEDESTNLLKQFFTLKRI